MLIEFPSVVDAVRCAVGIQRGMAERAAVAAADRRIDLRIGINIGDIIIEGGADCSDGVGRSAGVARNSTFVYKGKAIDIKQISRELGARYVLEGSLRKHNDPRSTWLKALVARRGFNRTIVALANKTARIAWVLLNRKEEYAIA